MDGRAEVQGTVAAFYRSNPFPHAQSSWVRYAELYRELGVTPEAMVGARALDAGCGSGAASEFLRQAGARVLAVDVAPAGPRRLGGSLQSVLDLGVQTASVDLVHCVGVLHHTADPRKGLREVCRVLRPGGLLVLGIYNRWNIVYPLTYRIGRRLPRPIVWRMWRFLSRTMASRWIGAAPSDEYLWNLMMDQIYTPVARFFAPDEVLGQLREENLRTLKVVGTSYFPFFPATMRAQMVFLAQKG